MLKIKEYRHTYTKWYKKVLSVKLNNKIENISSIINYCSLSSWSPQIIYVTVFWKTDRMVTNTEIHFMPVDECHTHALPRDTMHLRIVGQVCFYRRLFCDAVKPQGCISWPVWPLRGINKTAWGAKLILTAGLVHHSSCASLGHLLMAQHCHFCLGVCFSPPTATHPPPPPTPYGLNPRYYRRWKKPPQKPGEFK